MGFNTDFGVYMNDSEIRASVPFLYDNSIFYNYKDKKDGYLSQILATQPDFSLDDVDMMIQAFSNLDGTVEKLKDATTDAFRKVEFEKGDSGKFTVNGEEVDCTGYKAVIDKDTVESIVGVYSDSLKEEESVMKLIERFGGSEFDLDDIKSQITSKMNEDDVLNLNVYLYDGQAAAIVAEAGGQEIEVDFKGGDYPSENMDFKVNGITMYEVEGKKDGDVFNQKTYMGGSLVSEITWDTKNGDFNVTGNSSEGNVDMSGKLFIEKDSMTYEIDNVDGSSMGTDMSDVEMSIKMKISAGAKIKEVEKTSDSLDLGNASEEEMMEFVSDVSSKFGGLF
jgi:hypothetical protein